MSGVPDAAREADLTLRRHPALAQTTEGQLTPTRMIQGHTKGVTGFAFFNDSRRVVTSSLDKTLQIWDMQMGASVGAPFKGHKDRVKSVAISPDNKRIASGGDDRTVIIWDVESKQMVFDPLAKHTDEVHSVCFSPDGKRLASGSSDFTVVLWDGETGGVLATLKGHQASLCSVAFSPDGLKLASGSWDCTIRVWGTDTAMLLLKINAHQHLVRMIVWSPDGQQLVSTSWDKTVKFWNSSNGDQIGQPCTGHTQYISALAISSDGSFIVTASDDTTARLWSTKTHQHIGQPLKHTTSIWCLAISPNRELLIGGDSNGKVLLWSIKEIELHSHDTNELSGNDGANPHSSQQVSGCDDKHSLFDILDINTTLRNACIAGNLHCTAEDLLTQEIDADDNNHNSYANRSVVRARNSEWDKALQDSAKSISIQPSLLGYVSKGIALCGNEQLSDAMEAFHLAFVFSDHDPITTDLLRLIETGAIFNASCHDEAMQRVEDLATSYQRSDALLCSVLNFYLRVQLAIRAFEDGRYSEAADRLDDIIPSVTDLFTRRALFESKLKIFTALFGWNLDSLWQTVNQRRCDACLRTDRVIEAVKSHQYMMGMIDEDTKDSYLEWFTAFKKDCTARCLAKGDEAVIASNHKAAIELYSAGIGLDPSCESLFAHRSKANLEQNLYVEALHDAEQMIKLNPSSYLGYELKYAALHGAQCYDEAIEAFKTMLRKLNEAPDAQIQKPRQQYVSPSDVEDIIRRAIDAKLENAPLRLINTFTGRLCNREAQIHAFMDSTEYKEILSSSLMHASLQTEPIKEVVEKYFSWAMLSHRWESKEPLLHDIRDKVVYNLDAVGTMVKLQMFCKIARDAGHRWAWSDTCCIDQNNNAELQRSVNSMFVWYRQSALTIIYLLDVPPSAQSGALANSVWNTRGWTVQEFLAPNVVLFYGQGWSLYLNDCSPNHKECAAIMKELEDSTGIDAQALVSFRPGMTGAREKLQWASTRTTTLQEDIAYSLFGIFGIHLPVIYGEMKQNALGRLLQAIIAQSGDISALDWVGKSSQFNSCLPAEIASYKSPPCTSPSLSEQHIQMSVLSLRNATVVKQALILYTKLADLNPPRFADRRLQLPCIAFPLTAVRQRRSQDLQTCFTYDVEADGLQDLLINTEDKLTQFSSARPTQQTFFLVRPWNRHDLGLLDFADETQSMDEPGSASDGSLGSSPRSKKPANSKSHSRASKLIARLRQPFGSLLPAQQHGEKYKNSASHSRALRLIVRLGEPFGALLLAQQHGGEYKRIASDHNIIAQVKDKTAVRDIMDARTLEIL